MQRKILREKQRERDPGRRPDDCLDRGRAGDRPKDIGEPSSAQPGADQASHFRRSYGALGPTGWRGNDILLTVVEAPFAELVRLSRTSIADEMRDRKSVTV